MIDLPATYTEDPVVTAALAAITDDGAFLDENVHYPMPSPCSPWCLVDRRPPDKPRQWKRCRHRDTYSQTTKGDQ